MNKRTMSKARLNRKKEHLALALRSGPRCSFSALYQDILLPHDSLTTVEPGAVDLSTAWSGISFPLPVYINAITGGTLAAAAINRQLGLLAKEFGLALAVGSQRAGLDSPRLRFTYRAARHHNPQGVIMANLPATATPKQAEQAVAMLDAQILQLFLNPAQEYVMPEGERVKIDLLANIAALCSAASVPVIVKEVGCGVGPDQAASLASVGVSAIDVGGKGGTNFIAIEGRRGRSDWWAPLASWGAPTPVAVAAIASRELDIAILAAGGVTDGIRALKCLALGAAGVGVAGRLLWHLKTHGLAGARSYLRDYLLQLRTGLALMGLASLAELQRTSLLITGRLAEYLATLGAPDYYCRRGR